jgi:hypothetical protein
MERRIDFIPVGQTGDETCLKSVAISQARSQAGFIFFINKYDSVGVS